MNKTTIDWFRLLNSKGVGHSTFWALIRRYGTASEALRNIPEPFSLTEAEDKISKFDGNIVVAAEKSFPPELRNNCYCPPILFYKGNLELLKNRKIAIVGARNASVNGLTFAAGLAKRLSEYFTIVSGLARGIDMKVHSSSLKSEKSTVAVLPFGVNVIYPQESEKLYKEICKNGLVISEVVPDKAPDQGMIHSRNRLIAAISEGVVIVEAASKSGTMFTAQVALDMGVDVMAVPGSPLDPRCSGSNFLIKNGAPLIENYIDVIDILGINKKSDWTSRYNGGFSKQMNFPYGPPKISTQQKASSQQETEDENLNRVISAISYSPVSIELIARTLSIDIKELLGIVSELEFRNIISRNFNNEIFLLAPPI
jgi:DNA processing protein